MKQKILKLCMDRDKTINLIANVRIRLVHEYEILKNMTNRKLILKSFNETKKELHKKEEAIRKYNENKSNRKPYDKFNDYWY